MARYWYKRTQEAQAEGPCRASEIRRLAAAGAITAQSLISTNETDWIPASRVKGLFSAEQREPQTEGNSESPAPGISDTPLIELTPQGPGPRQRYPVTDAGSYDGCGEDMVSISAPDEVGPADTTLTWQELPPVPPAQAARGRPRFAVRLAISQGWQAMIINYGTILGATLLAALIQIGLILVVFVGWLASLIVSPVLLAGLLYMGVMAYRNERLGVGDVLCGFRRFGSILGIAYLRLAVFLACNVPAGIAVVIGMALEGKFGSKTLTTFILTTPITSFLLIIVMLRLAFAEHICLDTDLGVMASVRQSWAITGPVAGRLLIFLIILGLVALATAGLCFLPYLFFGLPFLMTGLGAAYNLALPPARQAPANGLAAS